MSAAELTLYERIAIQMEHAVPLIRDLERILGEQAVKAALEERLRRQVEDARKAAAPATRTSPTWPRWRSSTPPGTRSSTRSSRPTPSAST